MSRHVIKPQHCRHSWQDFGDDSRYQVCVLCGLPRRNPALESIEHPRSASTVARPFSVVEAWYSAIMAHNTTEEEIHDMSANDKTGKFTSVDDIFSMSDDNAAPRSAPVNAAWVNVKNLCYQRITLVDGWLETKFDENRNKEVERAHVVCYYTDDDSRATMQFTSGWPAIKAQIKALAERKARHLSAFPAETCVTEMIDREPFVPENGVDIYFPLRFSPLGELEAASAASEAYYSSLAEQAQAAPVVTAAPSVAAPRNAAPGSGNYAQRRASATPSQR